jgi:hypothetical protein
MPDKGDRFATFANLSSDAVALAGTSWCPRRNHRVSALNNPPDANRHVRYPPVPSAAKRQTVLGADPAT